MPPETVQSLSVRMDSVVDQVNRLERRVEEVAATHYSTANELTTLRLWRAKMEGAWESNSAGRASLLALLSAGMSALSTAAAWFAILARS